MRRVQLRVDEGVGGVWLAILLVTHHVSEIIPKLSGYYLKSAKVLADGLKKVLRSELLRCSA